MNAFGNKTNNYNMPLEKRTHIFVQDYLGDSLSGRLIHMQPWSSTTIIAAN